MKRHLSFAFLRIFSILLHNSLEFFVQCFGSVITARHGVDCAAYFPLHSQIGKPVGGRILDNNMSFFIEPDPMLDVIFW